MWFKNLILFRFTEAFDTNPASLEEKLSAAAFRPCGSNELMTLGWSSPLGKHSDQLLHVANGFKLFCLKREEKVLPSAVINELLLEKIAERETKENRKLSKKERSTVKDELIFELLPQAFSFSRKTYAYIDPQAHWLVVDAASPKKAEELASHLRKTLGSLPVVPVHTAHKPIDVMTQWLFNSNSTPAGVCIENECELRMPDEEGSIVRCKRHDLSLPEIKNHLDQGKQVLKLALTWNDRLSFVLDEHLNIKRLKFLDLVQDQVSDIEAGSEVEQFDANFSIMTLELASFLPALVDLFGGEAKS